MKYLSLFSKSSEPKFVFWEWLTPVGAEDLKKEQDEKKKEALKREAAKEKELQEARKKTDEALHEIKEEGGDVWFTPVVPKDSHELEKKFSEMKIAKEKELQEARENTERSLRRAREKAFSKLEQEIADLAWNNPKKMFKKYKSFDNEAFSRDILLIAAEADPHLAYENIKKYEERGDLKDVVQRLKQLEKERQEKIKRSFIETKADEMLLEKGMPLNTLKFLKRKETKSCTIEEMYKERGYSMELVKESEQKNLREFYRIALLKIETNNKVSIGEYSIIVDIGEHIQKGYLIQKTKNGWDFLKTFPISSGVAGVGNTSKYKTPDGLAFVKWVQNVKLGEIMDEQVGTGKISKLEGKATVNTTALVLGSGEERNSSLDERGVFIHETEKISSLGTRKSDGCIRTGTFVATELGQYIKENNRKRNPIYIANTEGETTEKR